MYLLHTHERLDMKNIFEIFTTKLLLKKSHVLKKKFLGHISVNLGPILKIFGTIMIGEARSFR